MTGERKPGPVSGPHNQGEGDKEAAARYEESTKKFIKSGQVDKATKEATRQSPEEGKKAEAEGKKRAKEEDPALHRDYKRGT